LPEHEKDDRLDGEQLQDWSILFDSIRNGEVELDQAVPITGD
jgi:hypothetical protein